MRVAEWVRFCLMRQFLVDLLKALELALPPPGELHHSISYQWFGSRQVGCGQLVLRVFDSDGVGYSFFLGDEDFQLPPEDLVKVVVTVLKAQSESATPSKR